MHRYAMLLLLITAATVPAGEPWKLSIDANATLTLNTYSDSWVGGEKGTFSWATRVTGNAEKQIGSHVNSTNTLKLAFGQSKTQDSADDWSAPVKSTDLIDFESVWKTTLGKAVDPFISGRVITQFLDTRTEVDHYANPLDFTESIGAIRDIFDKERITWDARLGFAARQVVDRYPPEGEPAVVYDGGIELVTKLEASLRKDVLTYTTSLKVYEALVRHDAPETSYWRYPDINWENTLKLSIMKYVMVSWYVQLLYDREIAQQDDGGLLWGDQWKNTLAVGLTYNVKLPKKGDTEKGDTEKGDTEKGDAEKGGAEEGGDEEPQR
jgi:hypothetical protein